MRITIAATLLAFAATAIADPWKNFGGDLAYVGPSYNATFKAGDTIPLEYAFFTPKTVSLNTTAPATNSTGNGTVVPAPGAAITATLVSLSWIGQTGNQTLQVTLDNDRSSELAVACLPTDLCTGTYYPKRVNLLIPSDVYPSNYSISFGYTLSLTGNRTIYYASPVNVVASSANITSPTGVFSNAPAVSVTLPVYAAPKSSGLVNQVPKAVVSMTIMLASAMLLL
ncbi:hypothetical protein BGZ46_007473 [Entomortierella lignicola]|nr:hypothetical protein BGZ46_007473 [Entomortierella lignicola]